jgi:cytochrome c oxidase subunit 2
MNETLFFVLGITLTVMALLVAFVGLRLESFPSSKALMGGVVALFAFFVIGTAVFAWRNGEDEQAHQEAELAEAAEESEAAGDEAEALEETGGDTGAHPAGEETVDGAAVFEEQGCGSCHALAAAGSTGETGPDLDGALADRDPGYIEESIVDPAAVVAEGYPPNIMPTTYGDLPQEELDGLVQYLTESTQ